jgi:hypothetical protein
MNKEFHYYVVRLVAGRAGLRGEKRRGLTTNLTNHTNQKKRDKKCMLYLI